MTTAARIAQHLLKVHEGDSWTEVDITMTLANVTLSEALTKSAFSVNTIAALLHHISYWNRLVACRLQGQDTLVSADNGFVHQPMETDESWEQLKADNLASARDLAYHMETVSDEMLDLSVLPGRSSYFTQLSGILEHVHYHLGQIVMIKKALRAQG